jgi:hypothetical protein
LKNNTTNGHKWILTTTYYFTKWVESIPTKRATKNIVMEFLKYIIITCFRVPLNIIIDSAKYFNYSNLLAFFFNYSIVLSHSSNYYPQGNGLAKSSNNNLMTIIKKMVGDNNKNLG